MKIRKAESKDIKEMDRIWLQSEKEHQEYDQEKGFVSPEVIEDHLKSLSRDPLSLNLVALEKNEVIGLCSVKANTTETIFDNPIEWHLDGLLIHSKHRNKGIGKKLHEKTLQELKKFPEKMTRDAHITLTVHPKNKKAIEFHKKNGYEILYPKNPRESIMHRKIFK